MQAEAPAKLVKSAVRTLSLFNVFAEAQRPLTLAEIAEAMQAPKSSCHELIQTLAYLGHVSILDGGRTYYPSRRFYDLAAQINNYNPLKQRIHDRLKRLRDATGETTFIGRLQGHEVVYSEVFDGTHTIRYTARSGDFKTIHASALGKALLGSLDEEARQQLVSELKLKRFTEHTLTTKRALLDDLARGAQQGVYITMGEHLADVMAIAMPIPLRGGAFAVGMAGPISRMQRKQREYTAALAQAIADILR
jgi:DNA-binding IclR family transcriptional regulator